MGEKTYINQKAWENDKMTKGKEENSI